MRRPSSGTAGTSSTAPRTNRASSCSSRALRRPSFVSSSSRGRVMDWPHGRRRHAVARVTLAGMVLAWCPSAFALNPALDISQYGHTSWKIRDGFFKSRITVMAATPHGYLWLGTELGLLRFDGVRIVPWQPPPGQPLPHSWVRSLYVGRDGTLWIGTLGGLASWKEGTLRRYPGVTFRVDTLLEDRRGTVWAGGSDATPFGRRLCAIQPGSLQCHGEDSSLGRGVSSLYEDPAGALWVAADTGLWRWTPGPPKFYPLTESVAGLQSLTRGDDGTPLISTRSGIS